MNITEYKTKKGEKRYILKGAYIGIDCNTGKEVRTNITGKSKKEVKLKLERKKREFQDNNNTFKKTSEVIFGDVVKEWFEIYKTSVKGNSISQMQSHLKFYILPTFKDYKILKITTPAIQAVLNQWALNASKPLENRKIRTHGNGKHFKLILNILNRIFKYALSMGYVDFNPCDRVTIPKVKISKPADNVKFFTQDELKKFFEYLEILPDDYVNTAFKMVVRLLSASGLRVGECLSLEWSDIDFNNKALSVSKTTIKHRYTQNSPKTKASNRTIYLDDTTLLRLKNWKTYSAKHKMACGLISSPLVFCDLTNGLILNDCHLRNILKRCFKGAKLHDIGFHGFRHSHASFLLNNGLGYKEIQARLGHANISMTMDIYSHLENNSE